VNEARQFAAVTAREMAARHLDLFLDEVKIIEQPLGGRSNAAVGLNRDGGAIEISKDGLVLSESRQEAVPAFVGDDRMGCGKRLGVPRQLVEAEQFTPQGSFDTRTARADSRD
jgi:hypothetical protein